MSEESYRVLARKYRPGKFADLLGQEALVRTIGNAIRLKKVAHAFVLSGVRGVGKTTTARIIAKALNCESSEDGGAVAEPCDLCDSCRAVSEDRHLDVQEIDSAILTGIDDIRDLTEKIAYRPAIGRTKVYIFDEVHMLSRNAFNGLLKILEEPPPHVVFILATTDVEKIPITILSRCQRFDLSRVKMDVLREHFRSICDKEGLTISDEALWLLSANAEGSVRDGLSLLEQAAAISGGDIQAEILREMLGLANRETLLDLFEFLVRGDASGVLSKVAELDALGVDAIQILKDLLDVDYNLTRLKLVADFEHDGSISELERARGKALAEHLSHASLGRIWQVLFNGYQGVKRADNPRQALEMVLIQVLFLSDTPTPDEMLKALQESGGSSSPVSPDSSGSPSALLSESVAPVRESPISESPPSEPLSTESVAPASESPPPESESPPTPESPPAAESEMASLSAYDNLQNIRELAQKDGEPQLASFIYSGLHLVKLAPPMMEVRLHEGADSQQCELLQKFLSRKSGTAWSITQSQTQGEPTLSEQAKWHNKQILEKSEKDGTVTKVRRYFPNAEIIGNVSSDRQES